MPSCRAAEEDDRDYLLIHGLFYDFEQGPGVGVHGGVLLQLCGEYVYFVVFRVCVCLKFFCMVNRSGFVHVCFNEDWDAAMDLHDDIDLGVGVSCSGSDACKDVSVSKARDIVNMVYEFSKNFSATLYFSANPFTASDSMPFVA